MARTRRLLYKSSHYCLRLGKGVASKVPPSVEAEGAVGNCLLLGSFPVNISFLVPSVISIAAVTVNFHISLLFPVNCSYLSL